MTVQGMFRPGMRAYLIPLVAGVALVACTFLPWIVIDGVALPGFPDVLALWTIGLGVLSVALATLSLVTRKNSRHPLFVIGLAALGIMILSWLIMPRAVDRRALTRAQALAIVENTDPLMPPHALVGSGIYVGLLASFAIVAFGFTIVIKRVPQPYAVADLNDDV
jgi:hypothetical protein